MSNSLDQKVEKLYAARSKREAELHAIHEDILPCINSESRRVKVERLVTKCNEAFMIVVDKKEDLIAFAGKTEDPSAIIPWRTIMAKHWKITTLTFRGTLFQKIVEAITF